MRVEPEGPFTPKTSGTDEPQGQPKKAFPKIKKKDKEAKQRTAAAKEEKREKAEKKKERGFAALFTGGPLGRQTMGIEREATVTGLGSNVDRLVKLFQDPANRFFASAVQTVGVSEQAGEIQISVLLDNGVSVDINLGQGFQDLNITITGVTAAMQEAIDNQAHQSELRTKLLEAGFKIHQITTVRGDQPASAGVSQARMEMPTPTPESPEAREQREGEGEGAPGEERE